MACHGPKVDVDPSSAPAALRGPDLPLEIWRLILSYLTVKDLCRCCCVCRAWSDLIDSLDSTHWKALYLCQSSWRHPAWPRYLDDEPFSWKQTYRDHYNTSLSWLRAYYESVQSGCLGAIFAIKWDRKTLDVGFDFLHKTLKSALSVANDFDTISIHGPCVYDEQFEMTSKIPLEIIGNGELGSVVLNVSMELSAATSRLSNLVFKAPWFTPQIVKMKTGHLLVENCVFEDGHVTISSPATCHIRYSIFNNACLSVQNVNVSIVENCEFTNLDGAAITVDSQPKTNYTWSRNILQQSAQKIKCNVLDVTTSGGCLKASSEQTVTMPDETGLVPLCPPGVSGSQAYGFPDSEDNYLSDAATEQQYYQGQPSDSSDIEIDTEDMGETTENDSDTSSIDSTHILELSYHRNQLKQASIKMNTNTQDMEVDWLRGNNLTFAADRDIKELIDSTHGLIVYKCQIVECKGGLLVSNHAHCHMYNCELIHLQYGVRCIQNAKIILIRNSISHSKTSGVFMRLGSSGLIADNDISYNKEAGIDIRKNADPKILCNRIHHGRRSGIVVLGQGQGSIHGNDIHHNQEAGIYVLYGGNPHIRDNYVHHGEAAGIAINEKGQGCIMGNLISGNRWGGIDVRHSADPTIKQNIIVNGLADGIVIGKDGSAAVNDNTISGNSGCGVWIMSGVKPFIHGNQISNNGDHGIAFVKSKEVPHSMEGAAAESHSPDHQVFDEPSDLHEVSGSHNKLPRHQNKDAAISYNQIFNNSGGGISIQGSETICICDNTIHANRNSGIIVHQTAPVFIDNNAITCNNGHGLHVDGYTKVEVKNSGIYNNSYHGILCKSQAKIELNDIIGNGMNALHIEEANQVRVHNNRLSSPKDKVIEVKGSTTAHLYDNTIKYISSDVFEIDEMAAKSTTSGDNEVILTQSKEGRLSYEMTYSDKPDWKLENPGPRPLLDSLNGEPRPSLIAITTVAQVKTSQSVSANCQGSKVCVIL